MTGPRESNGGVRFPFLVQAAVVAAVGLYGATVHRTPENRVRSCPLEKLVSARCQPPVKASLVAFAGGLTPRARLVFSRAGRTAFPEEGSGNELRPPFFPRSNLPHGLINNTLSPNYS